MTCKVLYHVGRFPGNTGRRFFCVSQKGSGNMALSQLLDRRQRGTKHTDRMHRIMGVVADCGLAFHLDSTGRPVTDVTADGIEVTGQYERYRLAVKPHVLQRVLNMAPQFGYALNVPGVAVEVDGGRVVVRVPIPQSRSTLSETSGA